MKVKLKETLARVLSSIQALSGTVSTLSYSDSETVYLDYCKARRVGKVVYVWGVSNGGINVASGNYYALTTLPAEFRPSETVNFCVDAYGGTQNISGQILTSGVVQLYTTVTTSWWRYSVTYLVD